MAEQKQRPMVGVRVEEETKEKMEEFPKLNWSAIMRDCIETELKIREAKRLRRYRELREEEAEEGIEKRTPKWEGTIRKKIFSKDFIEELTNALTPKVEARIEKKIEEAKEEASKKKLEEV